MTQDKIILPGILRETTGKGAAGRLRREGFIPGIIYGEGEAARMVQVEHRNLHKVLHTKAGENALITLQLSAGADSKKKAQEAVVLVKQVQHHPVTHEVEHVDFHHVSLTKKISVDVPLVFKNEEEAAGVKQEGGILEHLRWDLEIECLPTEIPAEIQVDVTELALNQTWHVKEITLPEGTKSLVDPEQPVIACVVPKVEEEPKPEEAAEGVEEPEVLKQKGEEEGEAAPAEGEKKKEEGKPAAKEEAPKQEKK